MATHESQMKDFLEFVVESTKHSSTLEKLEHDTNKLTHAILLDSRENIIAASKKGRAEAIIFSYVIGSQYQEIPVYDMIFPDTFLLANLTKFNIKPVWGMVESYFSGFELTHRVHRIGENSVVMQPVDFNTYKDDETYVGSIVVSWQKKINSEEK